MQNRMLDRNWQQICPFSHSTVQIIIKLMVSEPLFCHISNLFRASCIDIILVPLKHNIARKSLKESTHLSISGPYAEICYPYVTFHQVQRVFWKPSGPSNFMLWMGLRDYQVPVFMWCISCLFKKTILFPFTNYGGSGSYFSL